MRLIAAGACLVFYVPSFAAWLDSVSPILTPAEKRTYLSLSKDERARFEQDFWSDKTIGRDVYDERLQYIDSTFGSTKPGSGANTDPGRVYLSLGAPNRVSRIPSSRIFVPLEIWYYDTVPGVLQTELRLIFYRRNSIGFLKLYSPALDSIRALLLPQAGTRNLFGPNDSLTESDIRKTLKTGAAEDEVITAAAGVAAGIRYSGNDEILACIASPQSMLTRTQRSQVTSRLLPAHPAMNVLQTVSPYGGSQIDLQLSTVAGREIEIEIRAGAAAVSRDRVQLQFAKPEAIDYTHRLDLLPGSYRVRFLVDGHSFEYPLEVSGKAAGAAIHRVDTSGPLGHRHTPFEFDGTQLALNPDGRFASVAIPQPGSVTWMIRQGTQLVWRLVTGARELAVVELPTYLRAGVYRIEAVWPNDSSSAELMIGADPAAPAKSTLVSYNANLAPAMRLAFIGHQWLMRGDLDAARGSLTASLGKGDTAGAQIDLARVDALAGNLDAARDRIRAVLVKSPDSFEALSVFAFIETRFEDYTVAAELYRRALALQDSPTLRAALAQLPTH